MGKILNWDDLKTEIDRLRANGRKLVFTNGCFDLLHVGHIRCLEEAAALGDVLFVAVNSDASVRRLKGPGRPVFYADDRARMLAALGSVDHVLIFDDDTPHEILERLRPHVLVKGGTTPEVVGRELVQEQGGYIHRTEAVANTSTTSILERLRFGVTGSAE